MKRCVDEGKVLSEKSTRKILLIAFVRWIARIWMLGSIGLILAFFIGEGFHPSHIKMNEWIGLLFFPVGVCVGMIVAWWDEKVGGKLTVASLLIFYLINFVSTGHFPRGWTFLLFSVPGFLFLFCWQRFRSRDHQDFWFLQEWRRCHWPLLKMNNFYESNANRSLTMQPHDCWIRSLHSGYGLLVWCCVVNRTNYKIVFFQWLSVVSQQGTPPTQWI